MAQMTRAVIIAICDLAVLAMFLAAVLIWAAYYSGVLQ